MDSEGDSDDLYHSSRFSKEQLPSIESAWGIEEMPSPTGHNVPTDSRNLLVPESFVFDEPTAPPLEYDEVTQDGPEVQQNHATDEPDSLQAFNKLLSMLPESSPKPTNEVTNGDSSDNDEELSDLLAKKLDLFEPKQVVYKDSNTPLDDHLSSESESMSASVPILAEAEIFPPSPPEESIENEAISVLSDQLFQDAQQSETTMSCSSESGDFHDSLQDISPEPTERQKSPVNSIHEEPISRCINCKKSLEGIQDAMFCPFCGQKILKHSADLFVFSGNEYQTAVAQRSDLPILVANVKRDHDHTLIIGPNYQQNVKSIDELHSSISFHPSKKQRQSVSPALSMSTMLPSDAIDLSSARVYAVYTFSKGPVSTCDGYAPATVSCFPKSQTRVARNPVDGKYSYSLVYTPGAIQIQTAGLLGAKNFIEELVPGFNESCNIDEYRSWILDPLPQLSEPKIFTIHIESWLKEDYHLHLKLLWTWMLDHLEGSSRLLALISQVQQKPMHDSLFIQLNQLLFQSNSKDLVKFCTARRLPHYLLLYSSSTISIIPEYQDALIATFTKYLEDSHEGDSVEDHEARILLAFRMLLVLQKTDKAIESLVLSNVDVIRSQWKSIFLHSFQVRPPTVDPTLYMELGAKVFSRIPELGLIAQLCYMIGVFSCKNTSEMPVDLFVTSPIIDGSKAHWRQNWWLLYMTNRIVQWINNHNRYGAYISNFDTILCPFIITSNSWYWEWSGDNSGLDECFEYFKDERVQRSRLYEQISYIKKHRKEKTVPVISTPLSVKTVQETFHTPLVFEEKRESQVSIAEPKEEPEPVVEQIATLNVEDYGLGNWKSKKVSQENEKNEVLITESIPAEHRASILSSVASFFRRRGGTADGSSSSSSLSSGASTGRPATRANLGEEIKFRYDPELKKWISGSDTGEKKNSPLPPPKPSTSGTSTAWSEISSIETSEGSVSVKSVTLETSIPSIPPENISHPSPLSLNPPMMISTSKAISGTGSVPKRQRYTDPFNLTGAGASVL